MLLKFSSILKSRPENLHLMSSFGTPELIDNGVHLTPYSGLEYLLYLFDQAGGVVQPFVFGLQFWPFISGNR